MEQQHYCLRWKYHRSNLQLMFQQLLSRGCFCDVTLACEGQTIRAHRVVLCACSTYFESLLTNCYTEEKDPIIIMQDVRYEDIKCLIEFMYKGEINVEHGALTTLLKTAEELRIKGLAEVSWQEGFDDTFDLGASSTDRASASADGTPSSSSSAGALELSSLSYNEPSEEFNSVETVNSSAASPAQHEGIRSLEPHNDEECNSSESKTCNSSTEDNIHKLTNVSSNHACGVHSSVTNNYNHSDSYIDVCARVAANNRMHNQGIQTSVLGSDIGGFTGETVSTNPSLAPVSGFASLSKSSSSNNLVGVKKKRGRPPLDKEYKTFQPLPKLAHIERPIFAPFSMKTSPTMSGQEESDATETRTNAYGFAEHARASCTVSSSMSQAATRSVTPSSSDESFMQRAWETKDGAELALNGMTEPVRPSAFDTFDDRSPPCLNDSVQLTPSEQEQWKDVVKMSDYLAKGRRPQFWEEPFTKRVMDGINTKTLEMKKAAKILGVSYGTLYGRYRETYGCLKHPYKGQFMAAGTRMPDLWPSGNSNVSISEIVNRIQQDRIASSHAAEMLGNSPSAIMSYLDHQQEQPTHSNYLNGQLPSDGEQDN